jgi:hypothetical protein
VHSAEPRTHAGLIDHESPNCQTSSGSRSPAVVPIRGPTGVEFGGWTRSGKARYGEFRRFEPLNAGRR